jgi:hypothetical protein
MALLSCLRCGTKFAVGLLACPHCLSEEFEEDGVPKITVSGGVSHPEDLAAVSGLSGLVPPQSAVTAEPEPAAAAAEPGSGPEPAAEPAPAPKAAAKAAPSLSGPAKKAGESG